MKNHLIILLLIMCFACTKDDSDGSAPQNPIGTTTISGKIILPEASSIDVNSLEVQSYTDINSVIDESYDIVVADNETNTLFVVDEFENVILMGYTYPNQTNFNIDAGSTVLAMIMNLPVSQSLSLEGRVSFINDIKASVDYPIIAAELETLISQGISPLDTNQSEFTNHLLAFFDTVVYTSTTVQDNNPVTIHQSGHEFIFQNPGKSYSSYVGIYKDNQRIEYFELDRVNFIPTSISEAIVAAINNATGDVDIVEKSYTLPSEVGNYKIKIRTGKSFSDGTDEAYDAIKSNLTNVAMDIFFGIVSFPEGSNAECFKEVASNFKTFVETNGNINGINSIQDFMSVSYDLLKNYIQFYTTNINTGNLPYLCVTNDATAFQKYLKSIEKKLPWLKAISIAGNAGNLLVGLDQWVNDDAAMDLCYTVTESDVYECEPGMTLSGDMNFGEVPINTTTERILTITNDSEDTIQLTTLELPEAFTASNWVESQLAIGESKEVTISFTPTALQEFSGTITVNNNSNQNDNTIEVSGTGVPAFTLSGNLDFGNVAVNASAIRTLTVTNNMQQPLNVSLVDLPTGFYGNWTSGAIVANASQDITITFIPAQEQQYSGVVTVNNDIDHENNTIAINGNGTPEVGELLLSGNMDFGNVGINTIATSTLSISNESTFAINVSSISLPNGFTADWSSGQIAAGYVQDVTITFSPTAVQDYPGTIIVNNDADQVNNTIAVSGSGVNSYIPLGNRYMDYSTTGCGESLPLVFGEWPSIGTTPLFFIGGYPSGNSIDTSGIGTTSEYYSLTGNQLYINMVYDYSALCDEGMTGTIEINATYNTSTNSFYGSLSHIWIKTNSDCSNTVPDEGNCTVNSIVIY